jgi:hypothetical protein
MTAYKGQNSLARLSRTCRFLRTIVQPILFHYLFANRKSDFFLFVRALVAQPDLQSKVREVVVNQPREEPCISGKFSRPKPIADMVEDHLLQGNWAPLWDALVSEGIPENRRTANAQLGERVPRLVSLLVHLASNLTSAYFTFYRRLGVFAR